MNNTHIQKNIYLSISYDNNKKSGIRNLFQKLSVMNLMKHLIINFKTSKEKHSIKLTEKLFHTPTPTKYFT